jgi:cysteine synthase
MGTTGEGRDMIAAIGGTALVELRRLVPPGHARVLVKIESSNPTGSMKDRMALSVTSDAFSLEKRDHMRGLSTGRTVVTLACDSGLKYLTTELYGGR